MFDFYQYSEPSKVVNTQNHKTGVFISKGKNLLIQLSAFKNPLILFLNPNPASVKDRRFEFQVLMSDYEKSIGDARNEMIERLDNLYTTLTVPGWDGYNANPLNEKSYKIAREIIQSAPIEILSLWNVFPSPKGIISFEFRTREVAALKVYEDAIHYVALNHDGQPLMNKIGHDVREAVKILEMITDFLGHGRK